MATKKDDLGQAEVQDRRDAAREKGYEGVSPSEGENGKFSLQSGPASPSAAEQIAKAAQVRADELKENTNA